MKKQGKWSKLHLVLVVFLLMYVTVLLYNVYRPLPDNISYESKEYQVNEEDVQFYMNLTGEKDGEKQFTEEIFTRTLEIIEEAEEFIILDYFLFNSYHEKQEEFPPNVQHITDALIQKKQEQPDMPIVFVTDEVNSSYRSHAAPEFEQLKKAGVTVVETDLDDFRDPTPLYSGFYRMFFTWLGDGEEGWLPNALAPTAPDMTVRSYLRLANIKANHRKTLTTEKTSLISSANPHDASFYFANVAFEVKGALVNDLIKSEKAAADTRRKTAFPNFIPPHENKGDVSVKLVTEGKIQEAAQNEIAAAEAGDEIWMAMFYLADRTIIEGLTDAANRGVDVNLILDTNKHSFGRKKTGLPNVPMAAELIEDTNEEVTVRWYAMSPEQFHPKMMMVRKAEDTVIISGSANYTTRNLNNFNPETDVWIKAPNDSAIIQEVTGYFNMLWNNEGAVYTVDYEEHNDDISIVKRAIYTVQKLLHFTTF